MWLKYYAFSVAMASKLKFDYYYHLLSSDHYYHHLSYVLSYMIIIMQMYQKGIICN